MSKKVLNLSKIDETIRMLGEFAIPFTIQTSGENPVLRKVIYKNHEGALVMMVERIIRTTNKDTDDIVESIYVKLKEFVLKEFEQEIKIHN